MESFSIRKDFLPASEDISCYSPPSSYLYSSPEEVEDWCHYLPLSPGYLPTPPGSVSDCALPESPELSPDMDAASWTQSSLSDDSWQTVPAPADSVPVPGAPMEWQTPGLPVSAQDLSAFDHVHWVPMPVSLMPGSVDLSLSPGLSYESQDAHTLNSFSEPDFSHLPAGLDLSFVADAPWDTTAGTLMINPFVPQDCSTTPMPQAPLVPASQTMNTVSVGYRPISIRPSVSLPQDAAQASQYDQAMLPRRTAQDLSQSHARPLLPRTDVPVHNGLPGQPQYRALRPQLPGSHRDSKPTVSSVGGHTRDIVSSGPQPMLSVGPISPGMHASGVSVPGYPVTSPFPGVYVDHPSFPYVSDLRHNHHGPDRNLIGTSTSLPHEAGYVMSSTSAGVAQSFVATAGANGGALYPSVPGGSVSSDADEGRNRNHPLYNQHPCDDGLYHCPFAKKDSTCQHQPTKLKCNYDKFIDSHLKPFRCKNENCAKQVFSSTACLLRHEREAHGMHGHGDKPHFCIYAGCDRGLPGNGFPRRYNLIDHMRRVHDHKDVTPDARDAETAGRRKPGGRKRKATGSVSDEPPAQRVKVHSMPSQVTSVVPVRGSSYLQTMPVFQPTDATTHAMTRSQRKSVYSQWTG